MFTFCAFLPYKVGPPVSSVVISYLKQKLHMDNVDEKATFCWVWSWRGLRGPAWLGWSSCWRSTPASPPTGSRRWGTPETWTSSLSPISISLNKIWACSHKATKIQTFSYSLIKMTHICEESTWRSRHFQYQNENLSFEFSRWQEFKTLPWCSLWTCCRLSPHRVQSRVTTPWRPP